MESDTDADADSDANGVVSAVTRVYWNDLLMQKIIGDVEQFKDRDALELSSKRFRNLALSTPITRSPEGYKICVHYGNDPVSLNFNYSSKIVRCARNRPNNLSIPDIYFTIESAFDKNARVIASFERTKFVFLPEVRAIEKFFEKIHKRIAKQVVKFELKKHMITSTMWDYLEKLPNLTNFALHFYGSHDFDDAEFFLPDPQFVESRVKSLTIRMEPQFTSKIQHIKCMLGPGLKELRFIVAPASARSQWFIEELMVEMELHDVQLEKCQVIFPERDTPAQLIVALTHFLSERSKIMNFVVSPKFGQFFVEDPIVPCVVLDFRRDRRKGILKMLHQACPIVFQKAEKLKIRELPVKQFPDLVNTLGVCYELKDLDFCIGGEQSGQVPIDKALEVLPSSLQLLKLRDCKFSASTVGLITRRFAKTLRILRLKNVSNCNTVKNFSDLLRELPELEVLYFGMDISPLLLPMVSTHGKLNRFDARVPSYSEQKLENFRQQFDNVSYDNRSQVLSLSNRH